MEKNLVTIKKLVSEEQCYEAIRNLRWKDGVYCPHCDSTQVLKRGFDNKKLMQRYQCKVCEKRFDDLSETVLSGHHQPLSVWILCLYFMGLNLPNAQIAQELDLNNSDLHFMTEHLRTGIDKKKRTSYSAVKLNVMKPTSQQVIKVNPLKSLPHNVNHDAEN